MALGRNEQATLQGGLAGAGSGAAIGAYAGPQGALIGAGIGFVAGAFLGNQQADDARRAEIDAKKAAEFARRKAIMKELGARQQADQLSVAKANPNAGGRSPASASSPSSLSTQGTIGASIPPSNTPSIAGTF